MKSKIKMVLMALLCLFISNSNAQDDLKKYDLTGYLSNMQIMQFEDVKGVWMNDNLIHNRLNFNWYPNDKLTFKLGVRNRIFTGESVKLIPNYDDFISASELGYVDMNWNAVNEQSILFNTSIDRLYFQYQTEKLSVTIGRQRINWGRTFAWNPNDIFNAYSFFDFDYAERPGSDAIRLEYYTGMVSSVELAAKIDKNEDITAAALWRLNKWNYDFQTMAGILNSSDYVIGAGWSGAIKSLDFKGEATYLHPKDNMNDTTGQFVGSISLGYTFPKSLNVMFEFLFSDIPENGVSSFQEYYYQSLSVKNLSFSKYTLFGQVGYQITPLLSGNLACMYYPKINGFFIGPKIDYSFSDNLFASIVVQTFSGEMKDPVTQNQKRMNATYGFIRLKWSF